MAVTRRALLNAMARLGGAGAVYETLAIWDFLKPPPAVAAGLEIPRESGSGKTVVILGAGVAGLCAAYELDQAGYDCVILEADHRLGGRSLTVRRGDVFREIDGPAQQCAFDEGLYLNVGPGRIPHHHVHVIDYCRRFGVSLQPFIFASRANLVQALACLYKRAVPATVDDAQLRANVVAQLEQQSWTHPSLLNVLVHDGTVELWGIVDSATEKKAVRVAAEVTPGVKSVTDNLQVRPTESYA